MPGGYKEVDPSSRRLVRGAALAVYIAGFALWIGVYHFGVGLSSLIRTPHLWIAFCLPLCLFALNLGFSQQETVNSFAQERQESSMVQQIAFYSMGSLFAFTGIISRLNADMLGIVAPILALALFFAIVLVMPPIWVSTDDPREIIIIKHIKTCFLTFAHGLIAAVMMYVIFYQAEEHNEGFALKRRQGLRLRLHGKSKAGLLEYPATAAQLAGNAADAVSRLVPRAKKDELIKSATPSRLVNAI